MPESVANMIILAALVGVPTAIVWISAAIVEANKREREQTEAYERWSADQRKVWRADVWWEHEKDKKSKKGALG